MRGEVREGSEGEGGKPPTRDVSVERHSVVVRITHWLNVACVTALMMSGLQIFNAHPALYWGAVSDFDHPVIAISAREDPAGGKRGVTTVLGREFDTTGYLGLFSLPDGRRITRAFPSAVTLPGWQSLADGRRWHFFFAWGLVLTGLIYALHGLVTRHLWRDLVPSRESLSHIGWTAWDHLRLRFPRGDEARRYNAIQQLTYLLVIVVIFPLLILTGLTMSPRLDAEFHELVVLFGGRQSARTLHFVTAFVLMVFVVVHVAMVLVSGAWNNLRSMLTGRYVIAEK
jgi:thiosulfate reductase cytochrome b subunit